MRAQAAIALVSLVLAACGETGQDRVLFPVSGAGTGQTELEVDGWAVTLERADVGFGPAYFCATPFADIDVCPQAEAEWIETGTIDALDPEPVLLGDAEAVTATVRSAMFDYGRSWLLTAPSPRANEGTPDGHSAVFVARAARGTESIEIHASVDVEPYAAGQSAVIGAATGEHPIGPRDVLVLRVDPAAWWQRVDFASVRELDEDGDGVVELERGDRGYEALVIAMTAGRLPVFEWSDR